MRNFVGFFKRVVVKERGKRRRRNPSRPSFSNHYVAKSKVEIFKRMYYYYSRRKKRGRELKKYNWNEREKKMLKLRSDVERKLRNEERYILSVWNILFQNNFHFNINEKYIISIFHFGKSSSRFYF